MCGSHPLADHQVWRKHLVDDATNVGLREHRLQTAEAREAGQGHEEEWRSQQQEAQRGWRKTEKGCSPAYRELGPGIFQKGSPPCSVTWGRQSSCSVAAAWGRRRLALAPFRSPSASPTAARDPSTSEGVSGGLVFRRSTSSQTSSFEPSLAVKP